jgi:hypothetical protein
MVLETYSCTLQNTPRAVQRTLHVMSYYLIKYHLILIIMFHSSCHARSPFLLSPVFCRLTGAAITPCCCCCCCCGALYILCCCCCCCCCTYILCILCGAGMGYWRCGMWIPGRPVFGITLPIIFGGCELMLGC